MKPKLKCVFDKHTQKVYCIDIDTGDIFVYRQPEHIAAKDCPECIVRALLIQAELYNEVDHEEV